jgi:hypothetical protein
MADIDIRSEPSGALLGVAIPAVYWSRPIRLEGNFGLFSTLCASYLVHLSGGAVPSPPIISIHFDYSFGPNDAGLEAVYYLSLYIHMHIFRPKTPENGRNGRYFDRSRVRK